jgi:hypothetical protein
MKKNFFLSNNITYIIVLIIFSFSTNFYYSHIGINPMDNFVLYNGGYRVLNGYTPFKDYWLITGPLLDYLNAFFFIILGVSWKSFIFHSSIFNSLIALSTYFLLKEFKLNQLFCFLYSASFSLLMYPVVGTPFVDHHATIFVILAFYSLILGIKKNNFFWWFLIPPILCLAFLSKQTPSAYALMIILIIIITFIIFNLKIFKTIFFPLMYGSILAIFFLVLFFYYTEIPINNFWLQYVLYSKSIGDFRFDQIVLSFRSIFLQYKFIYVPLIVLFLYTLMMTRNFDKNKKNIFIIISLILFSLSLIFHQMLTFNQIYIFFLIPLLTAFVHIFFGSSLIKNKVFLNVIILICVFSVIKYHYRFNEERKFNELEGIEINKSINANILHPSLKGLRWITNVFPKNPQEEIEALRESMIVLKNEKRKKSLITSYQFIAPALSIYDYSPNQWHHPTVSFPIKGQKYFKEYKSFFINNIKQNKIEVIYTIGKGEENILGLILENDCFVSKKEGKFIFSHKILKGCMDLQ